MPRQLLKAFEEKELKLAHELLSAKVATMLGRKMEEGDWDFVYCNAKKIPKTNWSNLNIDINFKGLGVEHKMMKSNRAGTIRQVCGTTMMHPAGTRSIRIPNEEDPNKAAYAILQQYGDLIDSRSELVLKESGGAPQADMRTGWLIWKDSLDEFLYFEERMSKPNPEEFYAVWHKTAARGARKASRALWIFEKHTDRKKFSITTDAGAKVQPYFDVPPPDSEFLYYFKVQGQIVDGGLVEVWLSKSTAQYLSMLCGGSLDNDSLSKMIMTFRFDIESLGPPKRSSDFLDPSDIAVPVRLAEEAYLHLKSNIEYLNDEQLFQEFTSLLQIK